ncbi:MAG: V-type ATP synthase subunit E family protein, partial [Candidatus Omnitrophota bacterium]|nr:V-type ATP synthase subunit E family protein [Candidatus Omnitrophota bacterium]
MSKEKYSNVNLQNLEAIRAKIKLEVEEEISDILALAKKESERILKAAKEQAARDKEKALNESDKEIQSLKEKTFSVLNLEKRRIILQEKSVFIENVIRLAKQQAEDFRRSGEYKIFLEKAILEAVAVID